MFNVTIFDIQRYVKMFAKIEIKDKRNLIQHFMEIPNFFPRYMFPWTFQRSPHIKLNNRFVV